jgi:hypothetical protein
MRAHAGSVCVTCSKPTPGVFCSACGQRQPTGRHTLRSLAVGALRRTIGEEGALATVWLLALDPGRVITDYLRGRTVPFVHPAAYLLLASAVFAVVVRVLGGPTGAGESDKLLVLLMVPFIAGAARLLFWGGGWNFAEHLIALMYLAGQIVLFLTVCFVGTLILPETAWHLYALTCVGLSAAYFVWGHSSAFAGNRWSRALRTVIALGVGMAAWLGSVFTIVTLLRR